MDQETRSNIKNIFSAMHLLYYEISSNYTVKYNEYWYDYGKWFTVISQIIILGHNGPIIRNRGNSPLLPPPAPPPPPPPHSKPKCDISKI